MISELQRKVLTLAASYIGEPERPPGSNCTIFGAEYGWNCVAWCNIFVSVILTRCGIPTHQASVGYRVAQMRREGRFHPRGTRPEPGWEIYFDWDGDGWGDHIGFVEKVLVDGSLQCIEGNTWNMVARRTRTTDILGFGNPYPATPAAPEEEDWFDMATKAELEELLAPIKLELDEIKAVLGPRYARPGTTDKAEGTINKALYRRNADGTYSEEIHEIAKKLGA